MSWSLRLQNGDLSLNGTSMGTTTGFAKLVQDLRCAILEKMGTDDAHPEYGSIVDSGRLPNGQIATSVIGGSDAQFVSTVVESEIRRICAAHNERQMTRAEEDLRRYGKSTLHPNEILAAINSIDIVQVEDTLFVSCVLSNGDGNFVNIDVPITTG